MYVALNIKTHNTLLTSMIKIDELVRSAKANNVNALALTDDNLYGVIDFYKACLKENIKPIIGLEVRMPEKIILYAKNYDGYKNLIKLSTIVTERNITIDDLKNYSNDLICIIPYESKNIYDEIKQIYKYIFVGYKNEEEKIKIKTPNKVYINEILCLTKEDEKYLKYLKAIKTSSDTLEEITDVSLLPLKYTDEKNNHLICELCNVKLKFHQDLLPKYTNENSEEILKKHCICGMKKIFGNKVNKKYKDRLKYELDIIKKMGFCDYFLIVSDYINYAKKHNILVGPGRGSAAGSLVSYTLGITTIDPLKYNLLFERFLNPERVSMPDIDVDFEDEKRNEVIKYCINKYGEKKVAPIITFGTLGSKQALRDVSRVLKIETKKVDILIKMLDVNLNLKENLKNKKICEFLNLNNDLKKAYDISIKVEGLKRHTSIHAAGIVMSKHNLDDYIPLDKSHGFYLTGISMEHLEEIGLLKMDFLGLKNLSLISNILKDINLKFDDIKENDSKALNIFTNAKTLGIFQFESPGMINFLKKLKPKTFEDIVSAVALFRPGPMKNIDTYIKRKNKEEKISYIHRDLEDILKPTYGIIVYQEQIMMIASKMAGFSYGQADVLRKAMSKKKENVLLKMRKYFIMGSIKNGYSEEDANKVYDLIFRFASYGFNKSHAVSYAMVSYKMAYLKAHFPCVFMKNLFNLFKGSDIKTKEYLYECYDIGINVKTPNINFSGKEFTIKNNDIYFPFTSIKGFGENNANIIVNERKNGYFRNVFDFVQRCNVSKDILMKLILSGAFNGMGYNRKTLISNIEVITNYSELGAYLDSDSFIPELSLEKEFTKNELSTYELELFGFYIANNPISIYKKKISSIDLKNIDKYFDKVVSVIGTVIKANKVITKNNEEMMFITLNDEMGKAEVVLFPNVYKNIGEIYKNDILCIKGRVKKRFSNFQLEASVVRKIE